MIIAVIQARCSSFRFSGKVVHRIHGKPLLQYLIERLERAKSIDELVVATSSEKEDEPIVQLCHELGWACFRGPLENVAERFIRLFDVYSADAYVRISGDSPMLDPTLVDEVVGVFQQRQPDLATNVFPRSFPKGESVEVLDPDSYRQAFGQLESVADLENVTTYMYRHPDRFRIENVNAGEAFNHYDLSIDRLPQAVTFGSMLAKMDRPHWDYGWRELVELQARAQ